MEDNVPDAGGIPSRHELARTYEKVATEILNRLRSELGLSSVESKQKVPGLKSGQRWELDAKGFQEGSEAIVVIEYRRRTTSRIVQEEVAGLALRIQDTGAANGLLVSPLGLQAGAKKVAAAFNVVEVILNADATPEEFVLKFLSKVLVGFKGVEARGEIGNLTPVVEYDDRSPDSTA
jgi:hypothetical protein